MIGQTERDRAHASSVVVAVKLLDRSGIVVRGSERTTWLNGLVTCDLLKLNPDQAAYGLLVEKKGRIQTDFFLTSGASEVVLAVPVALRSSILETLDHYLIMEDAELEARDVDVWLLAGPRASDITRDVVAELKGSLTRMNELSVVIVGKDEAVSFESTLRASVEAIGGSIVDDATWNALRIERGLPRFGVEFDATLYPQEASVERYAVSFDKGCYLGQEVVYMLENRGHVKQKLVPLDIDGDPTPVDVGAAVTTPDGNAVGDVKSSTLGPIHGRPVAIAMIKWAQSKPGTELRIGGRTARVRN